MNDFKINHVVLCYGGMAGALLLSFVVGIGGMSTKLRSNAEKSAQAYGAVQSATDLIAEKKDHAKQLNELVRDEAFTVSVTSQVSPKSTNGKLQRMDSVLSVGSIVTVGGNQGQKPSQGLYVVDRGGAVAIVNSNGKAENPFNPMASHLPILTPQQTALLQQRRQLRNMDLYVTPPEPKQTNPLDPSQVEVNQPGQ